MVQTALAGQSFRRQGTESINHLGQTMCLACRDNARLLGCYTPHPNSQGLVIYLHGWEGSQDSTYVLASAFRLFQAGFSVFRLNFRDHGNSHHLNEALFHSARLGEVIDAIRLAAVLELQNPVFIIGFSLGGNFALRTVRDTQSEPIKNLRHVFAISPVLNPLKASPLVDKNMVIRHYFRKKWTASLLKKQALFPEHYDFSELLREKTIMGITHKFLPMFTPYATAEAYFNAYRIRGDDLLSCTVPMTIITAKDDPIVPVDSLSDLNLPASAQALILDYGGHNGFFQSLKGPTWYDDYIIRTLNILLA